MDSPEKPSTKSKKKPPSPRRDGREAAVQYLYANDIQGDVDFSETRIRDFWDLRLAKDPAREFAFTILNGVRENLEQVDEAIREKLENFAFQRLSPVDRNILRVATFEILFSSHIPAQAAINEAIEIAKRFGGEESPRFINGVLDRIFQEKKTTGE